MYRFTNIPPSDLKQTLTDLYENLSPEDLALETGAIHPLLQAKSLLGDQIIKLESMESEFDRLSVPKGTPVASSTSSSLTSSLPVSSPKHPAVDSEDLEAQIKLLEESKLAVERELQNERSARESEHVELSMQNADLLSKLEKAQHERTSMLDRESRLHIELESAKKQSRESQAAEQKQHQSLSNQLESSKQESKSFQNRVTTILSENASLKTDLEKATSENARIVTDMKISEQTISSLNQKVVEHKQKNELSWKELLNLRSELESAQTINASQSHQLLDSEKLVTELKKTLSSADDSHATAQRQLKEVSGQRDEILREKTSLQSSLTDMEAQMKVISSAVLNKEEDLVETKKKAELERADLAQKLSSAQSTTTSSREQHKQTSEELKQLQRGYDLLQEASVQQLQQLGLLQTEHDKSMKVSDSYRRSMQTSLSFMSSLASSQETMLSFIHSHAKSPSVETVEPQQASPSAIPPSLPLGVELIQQERSIPLWQNYVEISATQLSEALKAKLTDSSNSLRKWQKECKGYRERAKQATAASAEKIAFRNFVEGDLALFLPTRNTTQHVWAAFNSGFPHYFLKPSGQVEEAIKTREWLVARITKVHERVVNADVS